MLDKVFLTIVLVASTLESDVINLEDGAFEEVLQTHDIGLVQFMTSWCGYCKRLAPRFEAAATALKNNQPAVQLFRVDCESSDGNQKTCANNQIMGYPSLKVFKTEKSKVLAFENYDGKLNTANDIFEYMQHKATKTGTLDTKAEL
jgi:protein disulfide isomerase family A protein 3